MKPNLFSIIMFLALTLTASTGCAAPALGLSRVGYSIQVGAFSEVTNAERLTTRLQHKGIDAFYFKRDNGLYAVRFGDFTTNAEARKNARKLVGEGLIGAYFIASPVSGFERKQKLPATQVKPAKEMAHEKARDMGQIAARTAERFVGIPYRWGGDTVVDGMDCSGFARAVYNLCGVNIPRTSREQYKVGDKVAKDDLKDGDLVFFGSSDEQINHVGIYVGGGRFVHAPRRGDDIKVSSLDESYFTQRFIGARRYF